MSNPMYPDRRIPIEDGSVFDLITKSCQQFVDTSDNVSIDKEALANLAEQLTVEEYQGLNFPLNFPEARDEVNFFSLFHLLNFGSGYDELLQKHTNKSISDTIAFGLMGIYMSETINTEYLTNASLHSIHTAFGIPIDQDVEVSPAIYQSQPHPLRRLAEMIRSTMNQTGATLAALQCKDFYDFVVDQPSSSAVQVIDDNAPPLSASSLVARFGSSFDGFNDRSTLPGAKEPIFLFRKAQALVADLHRRLKDKNSAFAFEGSSDIVCLADSQFATLLHGAGLVSAEKGSFSSDQLIEAARAASVVACQHVQSLLKEPHSGAAVQQAIAKHLTANKAEDTKPSRRFESTNSAHF